MQRIRRRKLLFSEDRRLQFQTNKIWCWLQHLPSDAEGKRVVERCRVSRMFEGRGVIDF